MEVERKESPLERARRLQAEQRKTKEERIREAMEGPIELSEHEKRMVRQDPYVWRNWTNPHNRVTRSRAVRLKCLDCCCGSAQEVKLCRTITCPLWPYRKGKEDRAYPEWPKEPEE
jgi:hypothetical protein